MARFVNVWHGPTPSPAHQCVDCGEVVTSLSGIMGHECRGKIRMTPKERADDMMHRHFGKAGFDPQAYDAIRSVMELAIHFGMFEAAKDEGRRAP